MADKPVGGAGQPGAGREDCAAAAADRQEAGEAGLPGGAHGHHVGGGQEEEQDHRRVRHEGRGRHPLDGQHGREQGGWAS